MADILDSLYFCIKVLETGREAFPAGDAGVGLLLFIALTANVTLLFDQESKLWGAEYGGVQFCPGSRQLSFETIITSMALGWVTSSDSPQRNNHQR